MRLATKWLLAPQIACLALAAGCSKPAPRNAIQHGDAAVPANSAAGAAAPAPARPLELSQLIVLALPSPTGAGKVGWDHMLASPVAWKTDGYADAGGRYEPRGALPIQVHGRVTTVLKRRVEDLPWTVTLVSFAAPQWGPVAAEIEPGDPDQGGCFGTLFSNCTYTAAKALSGAGLTSRQLCHAPPSGDGGYREIYRIAAPGRAPGYATFDHDFGSGGESVLLTVTWDDAPPPCKSEFGLSAAPG
jgi:hypothetical protein